jgi:hypothetical protein
MKQIWARRRLWHPFSTGNANWRACLTAEAYIYEQAMHDISSFPVPSILDVRLKCSRNTLLLKTKLLLMIYVEIWFEYYYSYSEMVKERF